jgi:hypothetical protein
MFLNFTGNPIKTRLTPIMIWGKLGDNGEFHLSKLLVHGVQRFATEPTGIRGDDAACLGRQASRDRAGALAPFGTTGVLRDSGSAPTVADPADGGGDAAPRRGVGCASRTGSGGAALVQAAVLLAGATLSNGQAGQARAASGTLRRAVLRGGGRPRRRRRADRSVVARPMGVRLCGGEAIVLRHRGQAWPLGRRRHERPEPAAPIPIPAI